MIYCPCGRKWRTRANSYTRKNRKGDKVPRKSLYATYYCPETYEEFKHADCPRTIGGKLADEQVWKKVCRALENPDILIAGARVQIDQVILQAKQTKA
ncbi:MAG: hypothetical protein M3R61_18115, partial [Chloroflexota bacterium]|nr:hypothetical protein [Chloroflexota bacterium]